MPLKHDVKTIIAFVVAAKGRLPLASERLKMPVDEILRAITDDQASLSEQLRAQLLLEAFDVLMQTQLVYKSSLGEMSPDAVARAYAAQMTGFAQLSARPTEVASEQPISFTDARQAVLDRLDRHQKQLDEQVTKTDENQEEVS